MARPTKLLSATVVAIHTRESEIPSNESNLKLEEEKPPLTQARLVFGLLKTSHLPRIWPVLNRPSFRSSVNLGNLVAAFLVKYGV